MSYLPKLAPSVGGGLGGLPSRVEVIKTLTDIRGEKIFDLPGIYTWTPPKGVTSVCVVCIGAGGSSIGNGFGGGGGGLGWKNNIPVEFGVNYIVKVGRAYHYRDGGPAGETSYFISATLVSGGGGTSQLRGTFIGDGGGNGGVANAQGGGGAGGYNGDGGNSVQNTTGLNGSGGAGGAGGGSWSSSYAGGGGGGTGLFGLGANGIGGAASSSDSTSYCYPGSGGSLGQNGRGAQNTSSDSGSGGYPGGGGGQKLGMGADGAVRIIWGEGRAFPDTDCSN